MNYLLDKKAKQKKFFKIIYFVVVLIVLFYFRVGIFNFLSPLSHRVFIPIVILGNNMGGKFSNIGSYFLSKSSLLGENEKLRSDLVLEKTSRSNYDSVVVENINLKEILGRKNIEQVIILSAILEKPNQSPYDTLVIDVGLEDGVEKGDVVFGSGNIPLGRIGEVYKSSAKVILFTNSGEKTQVVVSGQNLFMTVLGRGGGNFEMVLPRDFILVKGDQVVLPGINPYVLAIVETIISDPRDSFQKALLVSPVNIQGLKFVEVIK